MRRIAIVMLVLAVHCPARAGVLDFFKRPAALIMNGNNCIAVWRDNTLTGEVKDGRFLRHGADRATAILSMRQLDGSRVTVNIENGSRPEMFVAEVRKGGGVVTASYANTGQFRTLVECRL